MGNVGYIVGDDEGRLRVDAILYMADKRAYMEKKMGVRPGRKQMRLQQGRTPIFVLRAACTGFQSLMHNPSRASTVLGKTALASFNRTLSSS